MSYIPEQPPPASNSWDNDNNSIIPDNTSTGLLNPDRAQKTHQLGPKQTLNGEQIDWLLKRLSTDDQQEIGKILRECTWQMTTTRGLPFAALVTGSMYYARSRLPKTLHFGPKQWVFYGMIAFGSMCTANLLSMNTCGDRVKPKMYELYQKYSAHQSGQSITYESLRAANRQHIAPDAVASQEYQQTDPLSQIPSRPTGILYDDEPPPMSGTPGESYYGDNGSGFSKS